MRQHPDPDKIREMTAKLRDAHNRHNVHIDFDAFGVVKVDADDVCGTICCHAGALALAYVEELQFVDVTHDEDYNHITECNRIDVACVPKGDGVEITADNRQKYEIDWMDGSDLMARELMGKDAECTDLQEWARDNPDLWGNKNGFYMFRDDGYRSFLPDDYDPKIHLDPAIMVTLLYIARWWDNAAARIAERITGGKAKAKIITRQLEVA